MLFYGLIGLSLVLVGITALQFTYLFYLDRIDQERKKHIRDLERKCIDLTAKLDRAELRLNAQQEVIDGHAEDWAEVIEER